MDQCYRKHTFNKHVAGHRHYTRQRNIPRSGWHWNSRSLQWRHNKRDGFSDHQPHWQLFTQPFIQAQIKNIKAPRHWRLCGEFTGEAENVSIWWHFMYRQKMSAESLWSTWNTTETPSRMTVILTFIMIPRYIKQQIMSNQGIRIFMSKYHLHVTK